MIAKAFQTNPRPSKSATKAAVSRSLCFRAELMIRKIPHPPYDNEVMKFRLHHFLLIVAITGVTIAISTSPLNAFVTKTEPKVANFTTRFPKIRGTMNVYLELNPMQGNNIPLMRKTKDTLS